MSCYSRLVLAKRLKFELFLDIRIYFVHVFRRSPKIHARLTNIHVNEAPSVQVSESKAPQHKKVPYPPDPHSKQSKASNTIQVIQK
jgi:hypothetical protein